MAGDFIDAGHPSVAAWLAKGTDSTPAPSPPPSENPPSDGGEQPLTREHFARVTYRKRRAEAERLESRNRRDQSRLISRELVRTHVLGLLDGAFRRLLEIAPTIESRVASAAASGTTREERIDLVRNLISHELGATRRRATRQLRQCRAGATPPDVGAPDTDDRAHLSAVLQLGRSLQSTMLDGMPPRLFHTVAQAIGRAATGQQWQPQVFDDAMSVATDVRDETTQQLATMLDATLERALRSALTEHQRDDAEDEA